MKKKIYLLDTSFFEKLSENNEKARKIWNEIEKGSTFARIHPWVLMELSARIYKKGSDKNALENIKNCPSIELIEKTAIETAIETGKIYAYPQNYLKTHKKSKKPKGKFGISWNDAIQIALARENKEYFCVCSDSDIWNAGGINIIKL